MTVSFTYKDHFLPTKYFLVSYRALSDGRSAIGYLERLLEEERFLISEWKVVWIGACTILRTSIDLFNVDARSCINHLIREEIRAEWRLIETNKSQHEIFWEFLRRERNNILHEYQWTAYQAWMDKSGKTQTPPISLLDIRPEDSTTVILMKDGFYRGRNSLDLLKEAAEWVETRMFSAIRRAGFDPDEERNLVSFERREDSAIRN